MSLSSASKLSQRTPQLFTSLLTLGLLLMSNPTLKATPLCSNMSDCFTKHFLTGISDPRAVSTAMDERGVYHITFIDPSSRDLKYMSATMSDGELVQSEISVLSPQIDSVIDPLQDTDIIALQGEVAICGRRINELSTELVVWIRDQQGEWREELVASLDASECELEMSQGHLLMLATSAGQVYAYQRGVTAWSGEVISTGAQTYGRDLNLFQGHSGLIATHSDERYSNLFVSRKLEDWTLDRVPLEEAFFVINHAGVRSAGLEWQSGNLWIFHGERDASRNLDEDSDVYVLWSYTSEGSYGTGNWVSAQGLGGANAARIFARPDGQEGYLLTRSLYNNPVSGDSYGLTLYRFREDFSVDETINFETSLAGVTNTYLKLNILKSPSGWPVLTALDLSASGNRVGTWWLSDSDHDGVPDIGEAELGTNPSLSDTDGDGRSDGQELIEQTNPLVVDQGALVTWGSPFPLFSLIGSGGAEAGAEAGTPAGVEAGASAGVEAGGPAGVEAGTPAGVEAGTPAGVEAGTPAGAEAGTPAGVEAGTSAGVEAGTPAGVEAGTPAGVEAGTPAGVEAGAPAGVEAGGPAGVEAGALAGAEAGTSAGVEAGAPAGVEAGAPAGAEAGVLAGSESGTPAGPSAGVHDGGSAGGSDAGITSEPSGAEAGAEASGEPGPSGSSKGGCQQSPSSAAPLLTLLALCLLGLGRRRLEVL